MILTVRYHFFQSYKRLCMYSYVENFVIFIKLTKPKAKACVSIQTLCTSTPHQEAFLEILELVPFGVACV